MKRLIAHNIYANVSILNKCSKVNVIQFFLHILLCPHHKRRIVRLLIRSKFSINPFNQRKGEKRKDYNWLPLYTFLVPLIRFYLLLQQPPL